VKVGLALGMLHPGRWLEITQEADRLGYESVWLPEHLVMPVQMSGSPNAGEEHPPVPPEVQVFDVFAYLSFLAAATDRIRLGTNVFNIGLRHPFVSARAVATADVLSGGRIEYGIGASWLAEEWTAAGLDFHTRGRRVDEALQVSKQLWTERTIAHDGEFFQFAEVMFEPKPVQDPHPPVHVGGDSAAAKRRAALHGDGWIPLTTPLEGIRSGREEIEAMRETAGRAGRIEVTLTGAVTTPDDLERYADAGVDRLLVHPWERTSQALEAVQRFAEQYL
jgi:probable F420-dependent oxidoreductase